MNVQDSKECLVDVIVLRGKKTVFPYAKDFYQSLTFGHISFHIELDNWSVKINIVYSD